MNALANRPLIAPGDVYMMHQAYIDELGEAGHLPGRDCDGALCFAEREPGGTYISVQCTQCNFGLVVALANAEAQQSKKDRRLDRLMDDAQPTRGEDSP